MLERAAEAEVLLGDQVGVDAHHLAERPVQPRDDLVRRLAVALGGRFQGDVELPLVVGVRLRAAARVAERGPDVGHRRVGLGERRDALLERHDGLVGDRRRRLRGGHDEVGLVLGEEALGGHLEQVDRQRDGAEEEQDGEEAVPQHHAERGGVEAGDRAQRPFHDAVEQVGSARRLRAREVGADHRRDGQRGHRRDQDGEGERQRELVEQPARRPAEEQQRDEGRHQRHRDGDHGEADLARALQRRPERRHAGVPVLVDRLDHHDGVVDHEADGGGERHQRDVVDGEAAHVHAGAGCPTARAARWRRPPSSA